mmetsp:Transcript_36000/g.78868  ORF Transcript_36000/g.78868 Transcript_36000/m.78868 type:complete len:81 (+) Transcript_36000:581-823(+)
MSESTKEGRSVDPTAAADTLRTDDARAGVIGFRVEPDLVVWTILLRKKGENEEDVPRKNPAPRKINNNDFMVACCVLLAT